MDLDRATQKGVERVSLENFKKRTVDGRSLVPQYTPDQSGGNKKFIVGGSVAGVFIGVIGLYLYIKTNDESFNPFLAITEVIEDLKKEITIGDSIPNKPTPLENGIILSPDEDLADYRQQKQIEEHNRARLKNAPAADSNAARMSTTDTTTGNEMLKKYWDNEDFRDAVEDANEKKKRTSDTFSIPQKPDEKISHYLERIEKVVSRLDPESGVQSDLFLRTSLFPKFIIAPENISEDYIKQIALGGFAEQLGYERNMLNDDRVREHILKKFKEDFNIDFAEYEVPEKEAALVRDAVITDQKARLTEWYNYLTSEEARHVPAAYRYWAFAEMTKLGNFDEVRGIFNVRTVNTAAPFPELNQQALALVLDEIANESGQVSRLLALDENRLTQFHTYLETKNFGRLYALSLEHVNALRLPYEQLAVTDGEWRLFAQGSETQPLTDALSGFNTKWCIAGKGFARSYLAHSDVWIYFSEDGDKINTIPRAAVIHGENKGITEVRGIMADESAQQHLDSYITPIVEEKLKSIPGGEQWNKTMSDMKQLASIHIKHVQHEPLSKDELGFLYETERLIHNSGYGRDPRIEDILSERNKKVDLGYLFDVAPEKMSLTKEEALQGGMAYHFGGLEIDSLSSVEGIVLPEEVHGGLQINGLSSAEGIVLPKRIYRQGLFLHDLVSAKGLVLPQEIHGGLYLSRLTSVEGVVFPQKLGALHLQSLTSAQGVVFPEKVLTDMWLDEVISAEGAVLPQRVGGNLVLSSLASAEGIVFPQEVGGNLTLKNLISAQGVVFPEKVDGDFNLEHLRSAEGVVFPERVGGDLYLTNLISGEGANLPRSVDGTVYLSDLTSAEGMVFPQEVRESIHLENLTSGKGLILPELVGEYVYVPKLPRYEIEKLQLERPDLNFSW